MPNVMRKQWNGIINQSSIELAAKVIELDRPVRKAANKKLYSSIVFYGALACLLIFVGIDLQRWMQAGVNRYIVGFWIISSAPYIFFVRGENEKKESFEKYRKMLISRIKEKDFCPCAVQCNHREDFMRYFKENYNINIYY